MAKKTVLIIKHGYSETCDKSVSPVVSYGDVFRCTCLLEDFRGYHLTWITAAAAEDLLVNNHLIDLLILADSPEQLDRGQILPYYDIVINLEKQRDWCRFAAELSAETHYGFKDWAATGNDCFYPPSAEALSSALHGQGYQTLQQTLFQTVGREWTGQQYVLGYQPKVIPIYDIGLNHHVGPKWPNKAWPNHLWQELYEGLSQRYAVCWQQSLNSIRHYTDWLASCRLIITTDSLGLHLGLGLRKKIVALFGPTAAQQVYMYGLGIKLTPTCDRACIPCFNPTCNYDQSCMEHITVEMVLEAVEMLVHPKSSSKIYPPARTIQAPSLVEVP